MEASFCGRADGWQRGVNLLQLLDADLGVNGRGVEFFVSQQLLDEADVRPDLQPVRGAGVARDVAAAFAFQPGLGQPRRHHAVHHVGIERPAVAGQEQRLRACDQAGEARIALPARAGSGHCGGTIEDRSQEQAGQRADH